MAADDPINLSEDQFHAYTKEVRAAAGVPPEFGSQPIPPGAVRLQHLTWSDRVHSIREMGLRKDMASPHSEAPQVFATTGDTLEHEMSADSDRAVVEGYAFPHRSPGHPHSQLDIGSGMSPERAASRHSTVTLHGDLPPEQIIAVHEPWHAAARYLTSDPRNVENVESGVYDDLIEDESLRHYGRAIRNLKRVL